MPPPTPRLRLAAALFSIALLASACELAAVPTAHPAETATLVPSPGPSPSALPSPGPSPGPSPTAGPSPTPSPSPSEFISYTVQGGDTLYGIAERHETTWQSLVYWNRDAHANLNPDDPSYDSDRIEVGWVLLIQPGVVVAYEPAPGATPRPTVEPTPTSPPSVALRNGSRTSGLVDLTFDMGGRVVPAVDIMNWLIANDVRATVFMTGAIIDSRNTDAGRRVLSLVDGHRALFELGNHSYSHRDFRTLSDDQIAVELRGMEQAVAARTTLSPRPLFRPPYGGYDARVLAAVGANGYSRTILWDIDSIDWKPESDGGPTTAQIVAKVRDNVRGGSIILFHLGGYNTLDALPGILEVLRDKGLQPATVGEMLGL